MKSPCMPSTAVFAGTSTRKPRINPALVAAQAAGTGTAPTSSQKRPRSANSLKKKRHAPRLRNVDRSSAQTREVRCLSFELERERKTSPFSFQTGSSFSRSITGKAVWMFTIRKLQVHYYSVIILFRSLQCLASNLKLTYLNIPVQLNVHYTTILLRFVNWSVIA